MKIPKVVRSHVPNISPAVTCSICKKPITGKIVTDGYTLCNYCEECAKKVYDEDQEDIYWL